MNEDLESSIDITNYFDFYIKNAKSIQSLSKDEEYILAKNFKEKNDKIAIEKIIESNLNYIIKVAKNYVGYGLMIKDLVHEGVIGLIKGVKKFNPEKNVRLISFAIFWIKSEIHEYIIKNFRIVQVANTKSQKKIFFNLKKIKKTGFLNSNEVSVISRLLNVREKDVNYIELRLSKNDVSLDVKSDEYDYEDQDLKYIKNIFTNNNPLSILEKKNWLKHSINSLKTSFNSLDDREKEIFIKRWLKNNKYTLKDLANKYNISSERVRQIENIIIEKLRDSIFTRK